MRSSAVRSYFAALGLVGVIAGIFAIPSGAAVLIKDRHTSEPLVLDQAEDYLLQNVRITGVSDLAALTLTGRINSVTIDHCAFSNVWSGINGKASAAEAQGAVVGSVLATDSRFEDAQHQLMCLREGAFGTVSFQRCKFRTSDSFLKRIYADDPWRTTPPTTEFANIDRLELIDNEYSNTVLVVHPSVKMVVFRGDISSVKLQSPNTTVIRLRPGEDPAMIGPDGTALATIEPPVIGPAVVPLGEEEDLREKSPTKPDVTKSELLLVVVDPRETEEQVVVEPPPLEP